MNQHRADLNRRGMGAQYEARAIRTAWQIEGVVLLTGRVLGRNIERRKIVEILLDMRPLGDREAHLTKNRDDLVHGLADRVDMPRFAKGYRERYIGVLAGEALFEGDTPELPRRLGECRRDAFLCGVQFRSGTPALFGLESAQFSHC